MSYILENMYLKFNDFKRINKHFAHWPNRNIYTIFHTFWPQQKFTDNSFNVLKWVSVECIDAWCCKPNDFIYSFFPISNNMNSLGARKERYRVQVESGRLGFNCIATINISGSQAAKLLALCIENKPPRVNTFLYQQFFQSSCVYGNLSFNLKFLQGRSALLRPGPTCLQFLWWLRSPGSWKLSRGCRINMSFIVYFSFYYFFSECCEGFCFDV